MRADEYQKLASRTIRAELDSAEQIEHALHGMVGEIGELHSIYQKYYQGHPMDTDHCMKELGDLLWFVAEYCTAMGWTLSKVMELNIGKLKARYPQGFDEYLSLNRKDGDI